MPESLHRLIYYSRNRVAGSPEQIGAQIRDILAASRKNNAPLGITGALMFNAGCFSQVLEGKREVVESAFERIQQDDRHGDVSLLVFEPVAARTFPDWSMGFVGARAEDATTFAAIACETGFDPARASGDEILEKLCSLALEEEALV